MFNAQEIIEIHASEIMNYWNMKKGTKFTDTTVDKAGYTCSAYLCMYNDHESLTVRFSDHQATRGGIDMSLPYTAIVEDIADEAWFERNDIDEDDKINYRDERFKLKLENLDFYLK